MANLLLLLLLKLANASALIPSCLTANTTWDSSLITSMTPNIPTPELCQQICLDSPPCQAVTWTSAQASPFPLYCATFSDTTSEAPCTDCVSGPPRCSCSSDGECQVEEGSILEVFSDIALEGECAAICLKNGFCKYFTFFGDNSALRHVCILFSHCDTIVTSCSDCHTSPVDCQVCSFEDTLPDGTCDIGQGLTGLLVVGGHGAETSAELWSPGINCTLPSLPSYMSQGPTVDILQGLPVACYDTSCYMLTRTGWLHYQDTLLTRQFHTGAVLQDGILLVGGDFSPLTTEVVPVDGGEARFGFSLINDRQFHCSIQVSPTAFILSGSSGVYEYSNLTDEVTTRQLPDHIIRRSGSACSWYMAGQSQVLIVAGGRGYDSSGYLASTELLDYSRGGVGGWREAGELPSPRAGPRAVRLGQVVYVTGGSERRGGHLYYNDIILSWSPDTESWIQAGLLADARDYHGVTEVSLASMDYYCSVL